MSALDFDCDICEQAAEDAQPESQPGTCRVCNARYCGDCSTIENHPDLCTDCYSVLITVKGQLDTFLRLPEEPDETQGEPPAPLVPWAHWTEGDDEDHPFRLGARMLVGTHEKYEDAG